MKINFILPEFGLSGGIMVALRYANALVRYGHDVKCYAKKMPYFKPRSIKGFLHIIHRLFSNYDVKIAQKKYGEFSYSTPLSINNRTVRDADVTIATAWCTAFDVDGLSLVKGKKFYFIQGHEIWDDKQKGIQSYKLPMKHIVIAKWIDRILVNEYGCDPAIVIYNGVDLNVFKPSYDIRCKDTITISMLYHRMENKGAADGLKVLEAIHKKYPNIQVIMFGKQDFLNKPDYIDYYKDPKSDKLVEIYQRSDVFLFPAIEEGWGLTIVEAMACGCAIVGTNTGALLEIGVDGENALISEPGKPDLLEENLIRILVNNDLRKNISEKAQATAQGFSWEKSYSKFEKALE